MVHNQQGERRGQQRGYRPQFQGHQRGKNVYNDKQGEELGALGAPNQGGSQGNVVKRGNTESNKVQKSVHKQSLSDIKKGCGNRPVINLKHLKNFIPYQHFKMERLNLL